MNKKQIPHFNARMTQQGLDYINKKPMEQLTPVQLAAMKFVSLNSFPKNAHRAARQSFEAGAEYGLSQISGEMQRLKGEHKLMYAKLQQIQALIEVKGSYDLLEPIQSIITKIESNGK